MTGGSLLSHRAVSQRAGRQTVAPGQVVVYEITYQNLSSEVVTNVTLTDVLPKDTRLLNQTGGTVTIAEAAST